MDPTSVAPIPAADPVDFKPALVAALQRDLTLTERPPELEAMDAALQRVEAERKAALKRYFDLGEAALKLRREIDTHPAERARVNAERFADQRALVARALPFCMYDALVRSPGPGGALVDIQVEAAARLDERGRAETMIVLHFHEAFARFVSDAFDTRVSNLGVFPVIALPPMPRPAGDRDPAQLWADTLKANGGRVYHAAAAMLYWGMCHDDGVRDAFSLYRWLTGSKDAKGFANQRAGGDDDA
jgi:hypothetical protein